MPDKGTVLAFDFGLKRIGVAVGEAELRTAHATALAALLAAVGLALGHAAAVAWLLSAALAVVIVGAALTIALRLRAIVRELESR